MNMESECFDKPIWTLASLTRALPDMPRHLMRVLPTLVNRSLSNALRERIMLAVAAENRCSYCQMAHSALGRTSGLDDEEIRKILAGQDDDLPTRDRQALTFVRDLARRGFQGRDEALYHDLGRFFTDKERAAIEASAHIMNFANRFGNTFDAARARLMHKCETSKAGPLDLLTMSAAFLMAAGLVGPLICGLMLVENIRS